ncbi:MAG: 4-diphosphocytidyl-2-C-methyl-D-erythritol kinase [Pseudonocardiales bacterium]|nr:4-diphosphocytidyl-2-C-methyl-D-erythritol kinase [Pseudonocardiales bacterium]
MPASVAVRVPAKVNLRLGVGPLRPDGFHELVTVFHAVALSDEVVAHEANGLSLTVTGLGAEELTTDRRNLAWRAAELVAAAAGVPPDVHLELRKSIPVAGGLAGGSADAAGTLLACTRLWGVSADLPRLAAELGSDVPFALLGGTAVGTGRGERLVAVPAHPDLHWVLAAAPYGTSTAAAYAQLDALRAARVAPEPIGPPDALLAALAAGDPFGVGLVLGNDLQAAAFTLRPELRRTCQMGLDAGALGAVVSGSGPTCAFLAADPEQAEHIAAVLQMEEVCRDAMVTTGAAPGAEVVR